MASPAPTTTPAPDLVARRRHPAGRALRTPLPAGRSGSEVGSPALRVVRGDAAAPRVPALRLVQGDGADPGRSARPSPVRLTRRGRRLVGGLVVVGGIGLAALVGPVVIGPTSPGPAIVLAGESSVVVRPGDTLWSIAVALAPESDPRAVVDALQEANGLDGSELAPGQVLLVP